DALGAVRETHVDLPQQLGGGGLAVPAVSQGLDEAPRRQISAQPFVADDLPVEEEVGVVAVEQQRVAVERDQRRFDDVDELPHVGGIGGGEQVDVRQRLRAQL